MRWRELREAKRSAPAKLWNLARARRAGLRVPTTCWVEASSPQCPLPDPGFGKPPWIVRSAAPDEDTLQSSRAGQYASRVVEREEDLEGAFEEVRASLPRGSDGRPSGAILLQPLVRGSHAGIAFFDGFFYERAEKEGGNAALTAGTERGRITRSHLQRDEAWSAWLLSVGKTFLAPERSVRAIDLEYAFADGEYVLLQARPARFDVRRNPTLTLANHKEILGDPPSPWIVSVLERAGEKALSYFARSDRAIATWDERYAIAAAGRAWLNASFFFRLMDHWGLPRTFVTEGIGGELAEGRSGDRRPSLARMIRHGFHLLSLQVRNVFTVLRARSALARLERSLAECRSIEDLHAWNVAGMALALETNFAINGFLAGITRVRRFLQPRARARVVTEEMMEAFDALRSLAPSERERGLDGWLERFGHRGPLESDPARPRFRELRPLLLRWSNQGEGAKAGTSRPGSSWNPLTWMDRRREWFRDELMRLWEPLRERVLLHARERVARGDLETPDDVFWLTDRDLSGTLPWRDAVARRRRDHERFTALLLSETATLDEIEAAISAPRREASEGRVEAWRGIALSKRSFEGRVLRADDLVALLEAIERGDRHMDEETVLVVPALEPSWAVTFQRVGAVVTDLGGELSHASILLREIDKPAIVNCRGIWHAVAEGERVRIEGSSGRVSRVGANGVGV